MIVIPTDVYVLILSFSGNPMCGPLRRERVRAQQSEPLIANNTISFYPSADIGLTGFAWRIYFPKWSKHKNFYCVQCGNIRRDSGDCGCENFKEEFVVYG